MPAEAHVDKIVKFISQAIPSREIAQALERTGKQGWRVRDLPSEAVMQLVIMLGIVRDAASRQVLAALRPPGAKLPEKSAISAARYRVGPRPMMALLAAVAKPWARAQSLPSAFYRGLRLMALDAMKMDVPDTPDNEKVFGRPGASRGRAAFPQVQVIALLEVGTHLIVDLLTRPCRRNEAKAGLKLIERGVRPGMLVMWDRGYYGYETMRAIQGRKAHWLGRAKSNIILEPVQTLPDGSYRAEVYASDKNRRHKRGALQVRVIEYRVGKKGELIRLVTSLLEPREAPAEELAALYHERWELELVFDEVKTHQLGRPNGQKVGIRAQKPAGVVQEIYALALAHRVVRTMMAAAAIGEKLDPDRLSFKNALVIVRRHLPLLAAAKSRRLSPLCPVS